MQVPLSLSVVSLANASSLDPFPEHLKKRKLVEVGETKPFKPGYRTNVFAVPHKWKSLQRDLLPFLLWVKMLCSHIVSQFITKRLVHTERNTR